jgi:hypothetical protein
MATQDATADIPRPTGDHHKTRVAEVGEAPPKTTVSRERGMARVLNQKSRHYRRYNPTYDERITTQDRRCDRRFANEAQEARAEAHQQTGV